MHELTLNKQLYERIKEEISHEFINSNMPIRGEQIALRIGITANSNEKLGSCISRAYSDAVVMAGGVPLLCPITDDESVIDEYIESIDGLILSGGDDVLPYYVGEDAAKNVGTVAPERDRYEFLILRKAVAHNIPVMGICRGHQVIALAFGGTIYQDIYSESKDQPINHNPPFDRSHKVHAVKLTHEKSILKELLSNGDGDCRNVWVNSVHHQSVKDIPKGFIETAVSSDGLNEAMEAYPEKSIFSVQWHPEQMIRGNVDKERQLKLFEYLIDEARLYHRARAIHKSVLVVDSHVDTPMHFKEGFRFDMPSDTLVDLPKMKDGYVDAVLMAAYIPQGKRDKISLEQATKQAISLLEGIRRIVGENTEKLVIATSPEAVAFAKEQGKKAIMPVIENGYAIGRDLSLLRTFKEMGVGYITLCHNGDNDICDSASKSNNEHNGLSEFGKDVVREMNRLGIAIDVSHAGDKTIQDVLKISKAPIIASHSSVRAICNHPRNLPDELICEIASKGGVIQVCLYSGFLNEESKKATIKDAADHIDHIVKLVGVDHVGIGSDFDGGSSLCGCRCEADLIRITIELIRRGYSKIDLRRILGLNLMNVIGNIQQIGSFLMPFDN